MRFVEDKEEFLIRMFFEERARFGENLAFDWPEQHVFEHRVVCDKKIRARSLDLMPREQFGVPITLKCAAQQFEDFWRVGCFCGFLVRREAARRLVPLGRGTIIFTGASASIRGKPGFAHFSAAKAGLRMISQSMAREYGPLGIHVAHVVVDGGIDVDRLRSRGAALIKERGEDGLLGIDAIAENYWHVHRQPRSAWTQEIDLRPFKETF